MLQFKNSKELVEPIDIVALSIGSLSNPTKLCNTVESIKHKNLKMNNTI